ncbi:hypothetical protein [Kibdelosporangium phytohabitans]|uniref:hypothetical protein n=1 Tax=Kibdelosporangium phytohabitans TaxID=860235 RepID=UPI0012F7A2BD|nr:hypothetical protein [Kibdelosporangium phytohabitans]MBE1464798.1 hypothetical protein [Kibdelosporangium phytohabitans]
MHGTQADLGRLQRLLDESYAGSGAHLRSITTPDRRLDAAQVSERLTAIQVMALATVTAGESLAVTVHGTAAQIDTSAGEVRDFLVECYGDDWADWAGSAQYARIDAKRVFTFGVPK